MLWRLELFSFYFMAIFKIKKLKIKSKCLPWRALWRAHKPLKSDRRRISSFSKYNTFLILSESFSTKIVGSSYIHEHKECLFEEASLNFECEIWNFSPILLNKGNLFTNKKKKQKRGQLFSIFIFLIHFSTDLCFDGVSSYSEKLGWWKVYYPNFMAFYFSQIFFQFLE